MAYTVAQKISIAKISQYLAGNQIEKAGLYGGGEDLRLPRKLYMIRKNVEWLNTLSPADATLEITSNYLYALCGKYSFRAAQILALNVGGGTVANVTSAVVPQPYDWVVSASSTPLANGNTTVTLDGTNGTQDLRGYNIDFYRGGQPQYTTLPPDGISTYYNWNRITGVFTLLNGAAVTGEQMRISITI